MTIFRRFGLLLVLIAAVDSASATAALLQRSPTTISQPTSSVQYNYDATSERCVPITEEHAELPPEPVVASSPPATSSSSCYRRIALKQLYEGTAHSAVASQTATGLGSSCFESVGSIAPRSAVQVGDDFSSASGRTVYRNVPEGHPALGDATEGVVRPHGSTMEGLSLGDRAYMHDAGFTEGSGLTSWSADKTWALERQSRLGGVVIETQAPSGSIWWNEAAKGAESQVLIPGNVTGTVVNP